MASESTKSEETKRVLRPGRKPAGANYDYVQPGSLEHANLLGIRVEVETDAITYKGMALMDATVWGPFATEMYIKAQLIFKVNEFEAGPPSVPENAPELFVPRDMRVIFPGV